MKAGQLISFNQLIDMLQQLKTISLKKQFKKKTISFVKLKIVNIKLKFN